MSVSMRLLALSVIVAFAPMAQAGGLDAVSDEPVVVADDDNGAVVPMGSLGNSGALIVGGVLAVALIAAASGSSGSH